MLYNSFFKFVSPSNTTCIEGLRYLYRLLTRQVTYTYAISRVYQHDKKWDFALQFIGKISFSPYCIHLPTLKPIYFKKTKSIRFQPLHYKKLHFNTFKKIE